MKKENRVISPSFMGRKLFECFVILLKYYVLSRLGGNSYTLNAEDISLIIDMIGICAV